MLTLCILPNFKGTKKDAALVLFICLLLDALVVVCCLPSCNFQSNADRHFKSDISNIPYSTENDPNAFHVGDTLLPDYSHNDTLIVESIGSADTLNMIFDGVDLPVPATDSQIDSVLHKYCRGYYHYCRWDLCPYKGIEEKDFGKCVAAYVGNSESEAYSLDILHLYSPHAEYDALEEMLLND